MIKTLLATLAAAAMVIPAQAEPIMESEYKTMHSMGCMLLGECTDDVKEVFSMLDISSEYDNTEEFTGVTGEFHNMLVSLNQVNVKVFLADEKYFPKGHRGVYHTVSNSRIHSSTLQVNFGIHSCSTPQVNFGIHSS